MLGFLFHKKREEVQRLLHGRINRAHARTISLNNLRGATRGILIEVVWVVPCSSASSPEYQQVFPAVTRDLSTQGISIVHNALLTQPRVLIGLKEETDIRFMLCTPKHSAPLGYGFYHIGLSADEVFHVEQRDVDTMKGILRQFESPADAPETAGAR